VIYTADVFGAHTCVARLAIEPQVANVDVTISRDAGTHGRMGPRMGPRRASNRCVYVLVVEPVSTYCQVRLTDATSKLRTKLQPMHKGLQDKVRRIY
jgi:hypothetical protein